MAGFKPKNANSTGSGKRDFDSNFNMPEPKAGSRPARISLIVDLGIQERPDFEDAKTKETRPQSPCQQLAIFADLPNDVVDYGGAIGKQPYRLCLNKTFAGEMTGVNFTAVPPKDGDGNMIAGKPWTLHPMSLLTKLAKATKQEHVITEMDPTDLLDKPFMAQVEVKKTEGTKKDDEGNPIIYTNVNYRGCAEVPMIEDDSGNEKPVNVKPLVTPPMLISFDDAKVDQIKYLRKNIINMIKMAKNYAGSKMQQAIELYEAGKDSLKAEEGASEGDSSTNSAAPKQTPKKEPAKAAKKPVEPIDEDMDDDIPFN